MSEFSSSSILYTLCFSEELSRPTFFLGRLKTGLSVSLTVSVEDIMCLLVRGLMKEIQVIINNPLLWNGHRED